MIIDGDLKCPWIRIRGELWQIRPDIPLKAGQKVKITGIDELFLIVKPIDDSLK
jgi:membrane-bound ClpP family serine protease